MASPLKKPELTKPQVRALLDVANEALYETHPDRWDAVKRDTLMRARDCLHAMLQPRDRLT